MRIWKAVALTVVILTLGIGASAMWTPQGAAFRDRLYTNRHCCDLSFPRALQVTTQELRGTVFPSQIGQDKWVLFGVFPGVRNGFFLDVGSADGVIESNSKALEENGWTGICVDPFPEHMEGRTCTMMKEVVSSVSGQTVKFHPQSFLGGIQDTLGKWKDLAQEAPAVELRTITLAEILERNRAPSFIHFMSLDIEGAELAALKGIPFDKYRFGAMAIEHNDEEPKRTEILTFLEGHGYRRSHTYQQDDFYTPKN